MPFHSDVLTTEKKGRIGTLWLDRPKKRNAMMKRHEEMQVQKVARIVAWGAVLVLGGLVGLQWILAPVSAGDQFGITFDGAMALNQARGDIGGVFVGLGVITALGLVRSEPRFLQAVAIAITGVILGRVTGVVLDGLTPMAVVSILIEVILLAALLITANDMETGPAPGTPPTA